MHGVLCTCAAEQSYISRKSTQLRDNLKRTKSATKLLDHAKKQPDLDLDLDPVVVSNGSTTTDDRCDDTLLTCISLPR